MQIRNVEVKNYRSLKNVTANSLNAINMLYGHNNTGKSNFLRFVELVFRRKERSSTVAYAGEDGKREETRTVEPLGWWEGEFTDLAYMFTDDKKDSAITFVIVMDVAHSELGDLEKEISADYLKGDHGIAHISFEGTIRYVTGDSSVILLTRVTINRRIAYSASASGVSDRYFPLSKSLLGQEGTLNSLLVIFNDCVRLLGSDRYLTEEKELSNVPSKLHARNVKNWLFEYYMNSQKYNNFMAFVAFVKAYQSVHKGSSAENAWRQWPFSTGDVGFGRFGQNIDVMLGNAKARFPLISYGTGVQQILYILAELFFTPARIVLIEEIELNLSPTAQRELFINLQRLLRDKRLDQVLFTTHSDYFNYRGDFQIYEAILDKNGYTSINRKRAASLDYFRRSKID